MSKRHSSGIAMLALCCVSATAIAQHGGSFVQSTLDRTRVQGATLGDAESASPRTSVPSYLVTAAARSPLDVAVVLAQESIPTGIELRESDNVYPAPFPQSERDRTAMVPLSDVARAFNEHHREYQASVTDGVFVIRLADSTPRFLDEQSTIRTPVLLTGVMDAERAVFAPLDPTLRGPAIGGGLGQRAAQGLGARITLGGSAKSVADTLNDIVRQVPGAWQVTTFKVGAEWRISEFGFIYPDRSRTMHPLVVR